MTAYTACCWWASGEANARKYTKTENHRASVLNSVGVVPSPLFLAVQAKLAHNRQVGNSGKGKHTWLSGLLKCAKCGYSLSVVADKSYRYLACSGRYNMNRCDAAIHIKLAELEAVVQTEIEKLLAQCPQEPVAPKPEEDSYTQRLLELDRRAERLMDAFAESEDLPASYLQKALGKIEKEPRSTPAGPAAGIGPYSAAGKAGVRRTVLRGEKSRGRPVYPPHRGGGGQRGDHLGGVKQIAAVRADVVNQLNR